MVFDTEEAGGIRMSEDRLSTDSIRARFLADRSYGDVESHCRALENLFAFSGGLAEGRQALGCTATN